MSDHRGVLVFHRIPRSRVRSIRRRTGPAEPDRVKRRAARRHRVATVRELMSRRCEHRLACRIIKSLWEVLS